MKILEDYINAVKALEDHFGVEDLSDFAIEIKDDYFYISDDMEEVSWAKTIEDLEDNGDYYLEEIKTTVTTEELTLFLVPSQFGDGDYYIIFKSENRIEID
jgi:hypothetical protein